jgi:hypothetical protein
MDLEKLMLSKAIMDRHKSIERGSAPLNSMVENYDAPNAKYNINPDLLGESQPQMPLPVASVPNRSSQMGFPIASKEAIQKSKLPDEVKRLMMEHPIEQPGFQSGPTLSDDLINKASKLMGTKKPQQQVQQQPQITETSNLRDMMKDVVREVLRENGMLTESVEKTNDKFVFQVGKHIFEGRLSKVKKMS